LDCCSSDPCVVVGLVLHGPSSLTQRACVSSGLGSSSSCARCRSMCSRCAAMRASCAASTSGGSSVALAHHSERHADAKASSTTQPARLYIPARILGGRGCRGAVPHVRPRYSFKRTERPGSEWTVEDLSLPNGTTRRPRSAASRCGVVAVSEPEMAPEYKSKILKRNSQGC
jgi:hypothetical protein